MKKTEGAHFVWGGGTATARKLGEKSFGGGARG